MSHTVEGWVELVHKDGQPMPEPTGGKTYSGSFVLRVNPALHRKLVLKAKAQGDSLNDFCARILAEA